MRSSAHVSEHTTQRVAEPAERERPEPVRDRARRSGGPRHQEQQREGAAAPARATRRCASSALARLRPRVEVEDHLGVAGGLEDRALRLEPGPRSSPRVHQVAVVADGDLAVRAVDEERLRVREARSRPPSSSARGRWRRGPAARRARASVEDVGHVAHARDGRAAARRRRRRCRRSPARGAGGRRARGRSGSPPRGGRRSRRRRTRP